MQSMLARGVNVALGCDGGPSNNDYDMIREMKLAAIVHKAVTQNPLIVPAETVLDLSHEQASTISPLLPDQPGATNKRRESNEPS